MPFDSADNPSRRGVPQLVPTGEQKGKSPILLNRPVYQIGARESCRIRLISSTVSQVHALLVQTRHVSYIRDLASRNGVFVNGKKIREAALNDTDRVKIGRFEFVYRGPKQVFGHEPSALPCTLEVTGSPIPVPVEERVVLIGRRKVADIPLLEESVSNAHAVIFEWEGKRFIRDLGSRTGTYLNGRKIHEKELSPEDVIKVGETEIRYTPSTQVASVEVVESASDSQIAAAPSAEEVDIDLSAPVATPSSNSNAANVVDLADTIGELDALSDPSHHDTAMIPLSFEKPVVQDHGLELVPETPATDAIMPRSWREASNSEIPPAEVTDAGEGQNITVESIAHDEVTDLGLTSHLDELSPASGSADPLQLLPADEAATQEGNATIDLSNVDFDTSVVQTGETAPDVDAPELPLIAQDTVESEGPDDTHAGAEVIEPVIPLGDTLASEASPVAIEPEIPADESAPASVGEAEGGEKIEVIEPTEPTPESALDIPVATAEETLIVAQPDPLSDTSFSRQVEEFTEASAGEIVEPPAELEEANPEAVLDLHLPPVEVTTDPIALAPEPQAPLDVLSAPIDLVPEAAEPKIELESPQPDHKPQQDADAIELVAFAEPEPAIPAEAAVEFPPAEPILDVQTIAPELQFDAPQDETTEFGIEQPVEPNSPALNLHQIEPEPVDDAPVSDIATETLPPVNAELAAEHEAAVVEPLPDEPAANLEQIEPEPSINDFALDLLNEPAKVEETPAGSEPATDNVPAALAGVEINAEAPADEARVEPEPSLDDLALEALSSSEPPVLEEHPAPLAEPQAASDIEIDLDESVTEPVAEVQHLAEAPPAAPMHPVFGHAIPDAVETASELQIPEEPLPQEGSATIAPSPDLAENATTVTEPVKLQDADLISPPILPLEPQLDEIDLGIDPLPETAAADVAPETFPQAPTIAALSSSDSGIAASLTGGGSNATISGAASLSDLGSSDVISDPFDMPSLQMPVPPRPLKKRRDRGKQTVIRNFGKNETTDEAAASAESPFAEAKSGDEPAIAFPAPEGSVDVFGVTSPGEADQLLSSLEAKLDGKQEEASQARRNRRRGKDAISPRGLPVEGQGNRPPVAYGDMVLSAADAEARRKKLIRRMVPVALVGVLLAAGAWFAAWQLVPVVYDIQASVKFDNLSASDFTTQKLFRDSQLTTLRTEATRRAAILMLKDRFPQVELGFLEDPDSYVKAVSRAVWSNQQAGLLQLRYAGLDRSDDTARMLAVALAVYRANNNLVQQSRDATRNFNEINRIISRTENQLAELNERIEKDRLAIDRYQPEKLTAANVQLQNLDKEYKDAFAALKDAQAELDRLKKTSPVVPVTQPADGSPALDDAEMAALAKKSEDLAARLNSARAERAAIAKQARESLDAAYQQFQKQIEASQGAMQQSPELTRFVDTAQAQLKTIRELTEDFIASQQKEYQQLAEAKAKLDEKMQSRRADLWAKDEQLQELAGQREITIRKINAAKSDNLDKDVESLNTELSLIESSIKGRQDVLATDSLYADVINTLQQLIDSKQKELVENRKKTDEKLASLQKQFAVSLPTVEKLPQEQQALAADMKQRLSDIDAARRQYAAAADQASVENDVVIKSMAQQLASLQGDMEIRKQQILAAQNGIAVKQLTDQIARKEKEVADLTAAKDQAEKAFFASQSLVRDLQTARSEAEAAMNDRYEAQQQKSLVEQQLEQAKRDVVTKKKSVDEAITPIEPTLADVLVLRESDRRQISAIIAAGGVAILTLLAVLWLAFAAAHANPFPQHTAEAEADADDTQESQPAVV